jgi:transcriptional regulator with XRE-family HTH domain
MTGKYNTGQECAEKFGVPASQWSAWVNGKRTPEDDRLKDLAKFFNTTVEALKEAPPNWEEEKAKILKAQSRKKGGDIHAKAEHATEAKPQADDDDGTDDYIAIVTALAKAQAKFNKGLIPPDKFESSMKSIRQFIDFSYRDVTQ